MTLNNNERLDKVLEQYAESIGSYVNFGSPFNSDEDNIAGAEALYQTSQNEAKQAIISLIKELMTEAKIDELKAVFVDFDERKLLTTGDTNTQLITFDQRIAQLTNNRESE